jgi:hypothetical protein
MFDVLSPARWIVAVGVVAIAGLLRGFSGFGLALAAVPGLTLVMSPADAVPCVLLLQIAAGAQLVPRTRHAVDWSSLAPILAAAVVTTPAGTLALAAVPAAWMRAAIGVILLAAVALLARQTRATRRPSVVARVGVGALSGVLNGATAMAGPPVIAYFLSTAAKVHVGRSSLLMYFFLLSLAGVASAGFAGLVTSRTLVLTAVFLPAVIAGNALGDRLFGRASPQVYRRVALAILVMMALAAIGRACASS